MTDNSNTETETPKISLNDMKKFEKWTKSLKYFTGLGLTEAEKEDYKKRMENDLEDYQCDQCNQWKTSLLKHSKQHNIVDDLYLYDCIRSFCTIHG